MQHTRKFYIPIPDDRRRDWRKISNYDLNGYDITQWWRGNPVHDGMPADRVKLYFGTGTPTDFIPNPISLKICSDRLAGLLEEVAHLDIQLFDAPLLDVKTGTPVSGFKIVNAIRRVPCLDRTQSVISYRNDNPNEIAGIPRIVIDSSRVPRNVHIFRLEEFFPVFVVSQEVLDAVYHSGVKGLAFGECEISQLGLSTVA